jgi:hypothetical protein
MISGRAESSGRCPKPYVHNFEPLEKVPGTKPAYCTAADYVLYFTRWRRGAVAELAALKGTSNAFLISAA